MKANFNFIFFFLTKYAFISVVGNQACSSAKVVCRVKILPDLRRPFASEIFVKLRKSVQANDSQSVEIQCRALQIYNLENHLVR